MPRLSSATLRNIVIGLIALLAIVIGTAYVANGGRQQFQKQPVQTVRVQGASDPRLIPARDLPPPNMEGAQKSEVLVRRYPFDSRAHYLRFLFYVSLNDYENAEGQIDAGLATEDILNKHMPGIGLRQRFVYANFLKDREKVDEARAVAWPLCTSKDATLKPLRDRLGEAGLCS